ncbi:MAG TPA: HWE histidine kinase domain-containing protein [Caulobacteraceae bacterium]|nr:HWE histidine kinase domain-containing protein [Caulobacteraceae bacterium]
MLDENPPPEPAGALTAEVFRAVFDTSPRPLLLMAADPPRFTMLAVNVAHARTFATTPAALEGHGLFEVFPPDPEPIVAQFVAAIRESVERALATGKPDKMRIGRLNLDSPNGEPIERYWTAINTPLLDARGEVTHIVSAAQDVTGEVQERRSEQARALLMREVDHRARNALTLVQSLVRLSTATSLQEFRKILDGRIASLARAQTSLAARKWEGAILCDIVGEALATVSSPERFSASGPHVVLPAIDVQALSMVVHELASNAVKYGSLARPDGRLTVVWSRLPGRIVRLEWREDGPDGVASPRTLGFGSRLIAQLMRQLKGTIRYEWRPTGLVAELAFPMSETRPPEAIGAAVGGHPRAG